MMSIVFNFSKSYLHQRVEAVTLKAGYLLSSKICSAGTSCRDICTDDKNSDVSVFSKLDFLERMSWNQSEFLKQVRSMRSLMKRQQKAENSMSEQHSKRREGENLVNMTYNLFLKVHRSSMKTFGLRELKALFNDDNFCHYPINKNAEDPTSDRITASDLLQRLLHTPKPTIANLIKVVEHLKKEGFIDITVIADASLKHKLQDANRLSQLKQMADYLEAPRETPADVFLIQYVKKNHCLLISNDTFKEWKVKDLWTAENIDFYRLAFMIKGEQVLLPDLQ